MIDLLERLRNTDAGLPTVLGPRAARLLEWERITGQLAHHCLSARAAASLRHRLPVADPVFMELHRTVADELRPGTNPASGRRW